MPANPVNPGLDTWRLAESLFAQAHALPPGDRAALLANLHADDPALATLLESLLAADARPDPLLDQPIAALELAATNTLPDAAFGPYELLAVLGEGRSGIVYRARQRSLGREVALKALAATLGSGQASRRFATEALALRTLRHPNIVPILDAGTVAEAGGICRPFLAMELVDGQPITEHCRRRDLPLDNRLHLVLQLCAAAACAHRHAILHRDLSPANILVETDQAGDDHVRVIDFGLARFLHADEHATIDGHPLGTPGFMSPEQARGDSAAIDTRTDIFSIGAVLAALLNQKDVAGRPLPVPADLSLIIETAMRDDPQERYQTVDALAEDLRRLLEHRPIAARPTSVAYELSKYVRRHPVRTAVAVATVSFLALASVVVGISWSRAAASERDAADASRLLLREVSTLLHNRIGGFSEERRMLESLLPRLEPFAARYRDDPEIQSDLALLLGRLGDSFSQQLDHASALRHWERALDARRAVAARRTDDPDAATLLSLAVVRVGDEAGQLRDAERQGRHYLEAHGLDEQAVARWPRHPGAASNLASSHERLGAIALREGRLDDALRASDLQLEAALRVASLEGDTRRALWDLACAHGTRGILLDSMLRHDESAVEHHHALTLYTRLAERFPADRDINLRLASALASVLNVLDFARAPSAQADIDAADRALRAVLANDQGYRRVLSVRATVTVYRTLIRHAHDPDARDFSEIDDMLRELEPLATREGMIDQAGEALETLATAKASMLTAAGRPAEALDAIRDAAAQARRWDASPRAGDWNFFLQLRLALLQRPACDDPLVARLLDMESAKPRPLNARLDLLELLRDARCHEPAERLAAALRQTIPIEWTQARRRLDDAN
jgi:serine/threonine protein kinase